MSDSEGAFVDILGSDEVIVGDSQPRATKRGKVTHSVEEGENVENESAKKVLPRSSKKAPVGSKGKQTLKKRGEMSKRLVVYFLLVVRRLFSPFFFFPSLPRPERRFAGLERRTRGGGGGLCQLGRRA